MKKIILFTENYEIGGNNKYMLDLAQMAKGANCDVRIFINKCGLFEHDLAEIKRLKLSYEEVSIFTWGEVRNKFKLRNYLVLKYIFKILHLISEPMVWLYQLVYFIFLLMREKPNTIVCANGGYPAGSAVLRFCLAGNLLGLKTILSVVSSPSTHPSDVRRMLFWNQILPKHIDLVIANSLKILKEMTNYGFEVQRQKVIYNGIEGTIDRPLRGYETIKFVFIGRLEYAKGIDVVIEAIKCLERDFLSQCEFHFYGLGSYYDQLQKISAAIPNKIFIHGYYKGDLTDLMKNFDILLLPSRHEGLPYVILEAMRAGCVCLTSRVGGIPEAIEDQVSGFLLGQICADELRLKILELVKNKGKLDSISRNAQTVFNNKFEKDQIFNTSACIFD